MKTVVSRLVLCGLVVAGSAHQSAAQATGKPPASYNPQERAAVTVVQGWIEAWKAHDIDKLMSYMADNLVFRADVSEELQYGRDGFERIARGVMNFWCGMDLEEVFVVGGDTGTVVLAKRIDYFPGNPPRGRGAGGLTGMAIPVAIMFRVKNGKITEVLKPDKDEPIGNLVVHQEFLISQTLTEIAVFPIKK